ncbi:MAG: DUF1631 family protein [Burkholderiales bacterium]|nr:DUF1631 family protein [Burkholderiales bacterium]
MSRRPTLQDFVDDEMLRAPLTFDQAVDAVYEQWRKAMGVQGRLGSDMARLLQNHRGDLVQEAVRSLRGHVQAEIGRGSGAAAATTTATPAPPKKLELSLIDEDEVTADIELARTIERVKSTAEFELRELQAYTSALVDDVNVARDTNPFRPDGYVRALWQGAQTLPISRAAQATFLRDAAEPLARMLRQGYAAACTRLEEQGVEPAMHRTIVVVGNTTRSGRELSNGTPSGHGTLHGLRDSMPATLDVELEPAASTPVDQQLIELLSRLFDAIQSDDSVPVAAKGLLLRLHSSALRVALRDPAMLDAYEHPVWRFMDRLSFMFQTAPASDIERCRTIATQLVDQVVGDGTQDASRFAWALARLDAIEHHLLEQAVRAAEPEISRLQAAADTASMPIDVGTMDTVPAELMPAESPAAAAKPSITLLPGDRLRAYLQGEWRMLQAMWCDSHGDSWLLRDIEADRHWALRQRALDRLAEVDLAAVMKVRSLVRRAADKVLNTVGAQR